MGKLWTRNYCEADCEGEREPWLKGDPIKFLDIVPKLAINIAIPMKHSIG